MFLFIVFNSYFKRERQLKVFSKKSKIHIIIPITVNMLKEILHNTKFSNNIIKNDLVHLGKINEMFSCY